MRRHGALRLVIRSVGGYSTAPVEELGKIKSDDKSVRFAQHLLQYGPERHRDHDARGMYATDSSCYRVECGCGCVVRVSFEVLARQEASL